MTKLKTIAAVLLLTIFILTATHLLCGIMLSSSYLTLLCRNPLDFGDALLLSVVFTYSYDASFLPVAGLLVLSLLSSILTFPLGWLAIWLCGQLDQPWLILPGVLANGVLWGWLLWQLKMWKNRKSKPAS